MRFTLDQSLRQLKLHGVEFGAEDFCDAAWLAAHGFVAGEARVLHESQSPILPATPLAPPVLPKDSPSSPSPAPVKSTPAATERNESETPVHALGGTDGPRLRGALVSLPAVTPVSCGLQMDRALKPLRHRRANVQQALEFDEEATASAIAETGVWQTVKRPAMARWLDVELVIEQSPTMRLWQETALEFRQLLVRACAPRAIRTYHLSWLEGRLNMRTSGGRPVSLDRPVQGSAGRLILVVSDAMSFGWLSADIPDLIARWAARYPSTVLQMLPAAMWKRSALRNVSLTGFQSSAGASKGSAWPPVPVLTLDPASLRGYSRFLAGMGADGVVCYQGSRSQFAAAIPRLPAGQTFDPRTLLAFEVDKMFERFERFSSDGARKLARYLASAPLHLPVMRVIQHVLVPDAAPSQLAEIFLSGILYRLPIPEGVRPSTTQSEYEFLPGIRERLLDLGGLDCSEQTLRLLSRYFEKRLGQGGFFTALLKDPQAAQREWNITSAGGDDLPFARLARALLDRMGMPAASTTVEEPSPRPAAHKNSVQGGARFIDRNRPPRVHIEYELDVNGAQKKVQLPFVVGVLSDLSGTLPPDTALPAVADRWFREFDMDNFDDRMKAIKPRAAFSVANVLAKDGGSLSVDMSFESMNDFSPEAVVQKVGPLRDLLGNRTQLLNLRSFMDGRSQAEGLLAKLLRDRGAMQNLLSTPARSTQQHDAPTSREAAVENSEFDRHLQQNFAAKTQERLGEVKSAVQVLAENALAGSTAVGDDVDAYVQSLIVSIDQQLSSQLSKIMHHAAFIRLEGAWRGLHYLVSNTQTGRELKIKVLNISKKEVHRTLKSYPGPNWDHSPLFRKIHENEFGTPGGEPFGVLVGDYEFDHSAPDVECLQALSRIAATSLCPFIAAASPALLNLESWQDLGDKRTDVAKIFDGAEYAAWRELRDREYSRFVALAMPRFLARPPYSTRSNPVGAFAFEEEVHAGHVSYVWGNSAYAMVRNIARAFERSGWCSQIRGVESGGIVDNLPTHVFPAADGGVDMKCPIEVGIADRREHELARAGLMPLSHWKNTDFAAFIGAQSLYKPPKLDDKDASVGAQLTARLPYLFACCRFGLFLKCIVRDKIGAWGGRDHMEWWLNSWIKQYVTDSSAGEEFRAEKPLADAQVELKDAPEEPEYVHAHLSIRPHFQLESVNCDLSVVVRLPDCRRNTQSSEGTPALTGAAANDMLAGAVYISGSGADTQAVTSLIAALKAAKITAWSPLGQRLAAGDDPDKTARQNIMACSCFVPVFSENTAQMRDSFYRREWKWAAERAQSFSNLGPPFVMPVCIDASKMDESSPPKSFLSLQASSAPGGIPNQEFVELLAARQRGAAS